MHHDLAVLTPEKTVVTYRLAGIGSRAGAHALDVSLMAMILAGGAYAIAAALAIEPGIAALATMVWLTFGPFAYFAIFEALWNGQTPGKKALSIRVRMSDGLPVTAGAALFRNLLRPADFLPALYLAGFLCMFTNQRSQRIGDLAAGTVVTHESRATPRFSASPHHVGLHPFEVAVGDLRGMTADEYAAIKRLCDRFPELPAEIQERNLREVWRPFALRRGVPDLPGVHPIFVMEAVVMRYGRTRGLL